MGSGRTSDWMIEEQYHRPREVGSAESDGEEVMSLLSGQLNLYERLRKLVDRQHELISQEDPSPLIALLAERQRLTADLASASARLAPVREKWSRVRETLTADQRDKSERMLASVADHLTAIIAADSRDVTQLEVRKRSVAAEMRSLPRTGAMLSAYGRSNSSGTTAFDRMDGDE